MLMLDKYGNPVETGNILMFATSEQKFKVLSISADEKEAKLQELRDDGKEKLYNCTNAAARLSWHVKG